MYVVHSPRAYIVQTPTSGPRPDRSEADSLDALVADLTGAQGDLSSSLIEQRNSASPDPSAIAQGEQQLAAILAAKQKLATAGPGAAGRLSAEISGIIASAVSAARTIQTAAASNGGATTLAAASQAAREAVSDFQDAYFKQRKFDPYLTFASEEDERTYRKREEERQRQIEQARAQGTLEGDKRAADLALDQLRDAGAQGADRSPDFAPLYDKLTSASGALAAQLEASKVKQAQGAQITDDPLDAQAAAPVTVPMDLLAKFKSAGVVVADQSATGHGVSADVTQPDRGSRLPS